MNIEKTAIMQDYVVTAVGMHTGCRKRPEIGNIDMEVGIFKTAKGNVIKQLCGFSVAKEPVHHWFCIYGTKAQIESPRTPEGKHLMWLEDMHTRSIELPLSTNHRGAPPEATPGGHGTGPNAARGSARTMSAEQGGVPVGQGLSAC